jgi:hypothetical protein
VAGETRTFEQCFDITEAAADGFTERVYFTVSASADGGTLFKGGLKAKTPKAGYAGWGLPTRRAKMIGSRSVIVWPDEAAPGGATVDGFIFSSEEASQIMSKDRGTLKLSNAAAEKNAAGEPARPLPARRRSPPRMPWDRQPGPGACTQASS